MADGIKLEEKKVSKHAARRARKKGKGGGVVVTSAQDDPSAADGQGAQERQEDGDQIAAQAQAILPEAPQLIKGDAEPSLDDL